MKNIAWIVAAIIVVGGGWYWWSTTQQSPAEVMGDGTGSPSGAAGLNGSPDQGNMGQAGNPSTDSGQVGQVQQPGADGQKDLVIGNNLALGTDSNAKLGTYLIGYNGMTLYTYAKDTDTTSTCYDTCAQNWPPYVVAPGDDLTHLKAGVTGKVSTTVRPDGNLQLTYKDRPLYFYIGDKTGSDVNGQAVGGVWYVVKP